MGATLGWHRRPGTPLVLRSPLSPLLGETMGWLYDQFFKRPVDPLGRPITAEVMIRNNRAAEGVLGIHKYSEKEIEAARGGFLDDKDKQLLTTWTNWVAFFGWAGVAAITIARWSENGKLQGWDPLLQLVLFVEILCCTETVKIALGMLRGDLALSFPVHYPRLLMFFVTLPHAEVSAFVVRLILLAWAFTEVGRYPMILFPDSKALKVVRYAVPLVTFPMGAGTEAYAAYKVHQVTPLEQNPLLYVALTLVMLVNVVGGTVWYPG